MRIATYLTGFFNEIASRLLLRFFWSAFSR